MPLPTLPPCAASRPRRRGRGCLLFTLFAAASLRGGAGCKHNSIHARPARLRLSIGSIGAFPQAVPAAFIPAGCNRVQNFQNDLHRFKTVRVSDMLRASCRSLSCELWLLASFSRVFARLRMSSVTLQGAPTLLTSRSMMMRTMLEFVTRLPDSLPFHCHSCNNSAGVTCGA